MISCSEPDCDKKFKRPQDAKMHWTKVHSPESHPIKSLNTVKRKYTKRNGKLTLDDAIVALTVKRDSFNEVLLILENLR